jgi:molecular chaperone DnaK (HSP70)
MTTNTVYGIDLGTTYSCIARVDSYGKAEVIPNSDGDLITPSVVYFESADNICVGKNAKDEARYNPALVKSMIKRAMGDQTALFHFHGQDYRPQQISSYILRRLTEDAVQITSDPVRDVVITHPAYFDVNQIEATRQAGELAGLNVLSLIPEPTAAAIAYGMNESADQTLLVYDLGGGTFDITLITVEAGAITVRSVDGDWELGGRDWDGLLVEHFANCFTDATGVPTDQLLNDPETLEILLAEAEKTKRDLSKKNTVTVSLLHGAERVRVDLTREQFDAMTRPKLEATLSLTRKMIDHARDLGYPRIDKLLLVGGSSFMPQVQEAVGALGIPTQLTDPNLSVAKGAAIFGFKLQLEQSIRIAIATQTGQAAEEVQLDKVAEGVKRAAEADVARRFGLPADSMRKLVDKTITNVTAKSFGIVVHVADLNAERVANLILKDTAIPVEVTRTFGTSAEGQDRVDLRCMENKRITADDEVLELTDCKDIGRAELAFGRPVHQGYPVEVTFRLSADGSLYVRGRDPQTGKAIDATFKTDSIMTQEELADARARALATRVSD